MYERLRGEVRRASARNAVRVKEYLTPYLCGRVMCQVVKLRKCKTVAQQTDASHFRRCASYLYIHI